MPRYQNAAILASELSVNKGAFALVGDTQRTLIPERFFLGRESNPRETEFILESVALERIDFLLHLGDMVGNGGSAAAWSWFDRAMEPVLRAHIPVLPILGNHEFLFGGGQNLPPVKDRFPTLAEKRWFTRRYGLIQIIGLDTNRRFMTVTEWQEQIFWLKHTLRKADEDPAVRGVVLLGHHPAYTNSPCVPDSVDVQEEILPALVEAKKTLAYFSGHAHGYEHFKLKGKHLIVSAGGGGPRAPVQTGSKERHIDLFRGPALRPFNYVIARQTAEGLEVSIRGFQKGERAIHLVDHYTLPYLRAE